MENSNQKYTHVALSPYANAQLLVTLQHDKSFKATMLTFHEASFIDDQAFKPAESFTINGEDSIRKLYYLLAAYFCNPANNTL